ncbi:MAG: RNA polymerase sigma factor [Planctomycetota bacterium]|nr:RNA polymerase sigma factor [Planctomycetota bacterium]
MNTLELVENIRAGRDVRQSQDGLYSGLRGALLERIQRKLLPRVQSRLDAEDVLHEAFLRGMGALDLFHPRSEGSFHAWIYTIAKNVILDQAKRRSLGAAHLVAGDEEGGPRASEIQAKQRRVESLAQGRDAVEAFLGLLKDKEAEVIRLHRIDGLSFAEISERWGKTPEAVKQYYARSWRKLRELTGQDPDS